jgi:hypothetical protein
MYPGFLLHSRILMLTVHRANMGPDSPGDLPFGSCLNRFDVLHRVSFVAFTPWLRDHGYTATHHRIFGIQIHGKDGTDCASFFFGHLSPLPCKEP